jgi:hypothetical protein
MPPFLIRPKPEYDISVVYICDAFLAVYQGAVLGLQELKIRLPEQGEEIYFRHISLFIYNPPYIEVTLSNGTTRRFPVNSEQSTSLLATLRAKLRGGAPTPGAPIDANIFRPEPVTSPSNLKVDLSARYHGTGSNEERYCYVRLSKLNQLLSDSSLLDQLMEQLEVPGEPAVLRRLTQQQKVECIKTQVEHFQRSQTSIWRGVTTLEVLAASIWRLQYADSRHGKAPLTKRTIRRGIFCAVSEEADLEIPVARWLKKQGYEPFREIRLGLGRVDVLGYKKTGFSNRLAAVELKNDYEQFKRAINQLVTFAEYADLVYLACTPAFAAEYLDHNEQSVDHWDPGVLERKLIDGGFGLLIVERDQVFEVIKPVERTPSSANFSRVVSNLSTVTVIEC